MLKLVSSIGNAAYNTAAKSGLTAGSEQPPYPCALPLQVIADPCDTTHITNVLDATFAAMQDMLGGMERLNESLADSSSKRPWKQVDYTDKEGDLKLFSRPHVGPYNFARATMTLSNVHPTTVLSCMHAQSLEARKRYSAQLAEYTIIARNPQLPKEFIGNDDTKLEQLAAAGVRDWHVEYNRYAPPPVVAPRDMMFLVEKRYVAEEDTYYIYGCSVDYLPHKPSAASSKCVRGVVMFGWQLMPVGPNTMATYISCMNPNGWAPTFLVGWLKGEIAKELTNSRRLLYGEAFTVEPADNSAFLAENVSCSSSSSLSKTGLGKKGGQLGGTVGFDVRREELREQVETERERLRRSLRPNDVTYAALNPALSIAAAVDGPMSTSQQQQYESEDMVDEDEEEELMYDEDDRIFEEDEELIIVEW